jgi:multiple sugar transport system substrate-binding protein
MVAVFGLAWASAQTTITFWSAYNKTDKEFSTLTKTLIPAFEKAHPDIKVKAVDFPYDKLRQNLLTSIAGGGFPDVLRSDIIWVPEFANLGALAQLDGMPGFDALKADVFPGALSTNLWKGHYYGLPLDTNTITLIYNKTMFKEAGIANPPKTFDAFVSDIKKLTVKKDGKTTRYGFVMSSTDPWSYMSFLWSNGGSITNKDHTEASGYLDSAASVKAMETIAQLSQEGYMKVVGPGDLAADQGLGQGVYAMNQDGPWTYPDLHSSYPQLDLGFAPFPAGSSGSVTPVGGEDIVISSQSKHKKAAWMFVQFMLSKEAQQAMYKTGQMSVLKDSSSWPVVQESPIYPVYVQQLKHTRARTPVPNWPKMDTVLTNAFEAIILKHADVQKTLSNAAKQIDPLLKQ